MDEVLDRPTDATDSLLVSAPVTWEWKDETNKMLLQTWCDTFHDSEEPFEC